MAKGRAYEIEVADFNNDGFQDFAVRGATQYQVEYGKGDGTFFAAQNFVTPVGQFEKGSQHGDFNGDGAIDLAYVSSAGVTVVMNANDSAANLAGAVGFQVTTPTSTTSGAALPMTVTAVDAAGNPATGFRGTIFATTNDPAVTGTVTSATRVADFKVSVNGAAFVSARGSLIDGRFTLSRSVLEVLAGRPLAGS